MAQIRRHMKCLVPEGEGGECALGEGVGERGGGGGGDDLVLRRGR